MHGVLNLLKPPGMTSHDAVNLVRRVAGTKRVGHTGTLDPAAAGVLPICLGNATKLADYLQAGRKTYIAEATFGLETDSLDSTGEVISRAETSMVDEASINAALPQFRGSITQVPPLFSAIKQDGRKLYEIARAGDTTEIPTRTVEIHRFEMTRFFPHPGQPRAILHIECGSGTYVRSLIRDLGHAPGCFATMSFLVRTQSGIFTLEEAYIPEALAENLAGALVPFQTALESCAACVIVNDEIVSEYLAGRTRRSREAETKYRPTELETAPILFMDTARKHALLSSDENSKLFHLA